MKVFDRDSRLGIINTVSNTTLANSNVVLKNTSKGQGAFFNQNLVAYLRKSDFGQLQTFTVVSNVLLGPTIFGSVWSMGNYGFGANRGASLLYDITLSFSIGGANYNAGSITPYLGKYVQFICIKDETTSLKVYANGVLLLNNTSPINITFSDSSFQVGLRQDNAWPTKGFQYRTKVYNTALTSTEVKNEYIEFEKWKKTATPIQPPKTNFQIQKPYQLRETGLVGARSMQYSKGKVYDISGNGHDGTITGGLFPTKNGVKSNGTNGKLTLGNIGNVKSICMRIKLKSTTEKIMEGQSNAKLILSSSGTLTASDFATKYINGVAGTTTVAGQWMNVVLTSSSDVSFSACTLFINNTTYGNFEIEDLRMYSIELTLQQANNYHNQFARRIVFKENFAFDKADGTNVTPRGWIAGAGSYKLVTETTGNSIIKKGTNYLQNTVAGTIAFPYKQAYGTWEYSLYKGADANSTEVGFIMPQIGVRGTIQGYWNFFYVDESVQINRGTYAIIMATAVSYIAINTWYRIKITRSVTGVFNMYVKGGSFGNNYVLVAVAVGTNPATENTITTSKFFVLDFDALDRIADIVIKEGIEV